MLDEFLEPGTIERVTKSTSWVSRLVPVIKDNGKKRLCVDMSRANQAFQRSTHPLPFSIFRQRLVEQSTSRRWALNRRLPG